MNEDLKYIEELKGMKSEFDWGFEHRVMNAVRQEVGRKNRLIERWSAGIGYTAAASVALILISSYISFGSISADAILGLGGFDSIDLKESLDTYTYLYNE